MIHFQAALDRDRPPDWMIAAKRTAAWMLCELTPACAIRPHAHRCTWPQPLMAETASDQSSKSCLGNARIGDGRSYAALLAMVRNSSFEARCKKR